MYHICCVLCLSIWTSTKRSKNRRGTQNKDLKRDWLRKEQKFLRFSHETFRGSGILLGYDALPIGSGIPTFRVLFNRRNVEEETFFFKISSVKGKAATLPRNFGIRLPLTKS